MTYECLKKMRNLLPGAQLWGEELQVGVANCTVDTSCVALFLACLDPVLVPRMAYRSWPGDSSAKAQTPPSGGAWMLACQLQPGSKTGTVPESVSFLHAGGAFAERWQEYQLCAWLCGTPVRYARPPEHLYDPDLRCSGSVWACRQKRRVKTV